MVRVQLGVHQHDVFAVLERLQHDARAELDRAGDVREHVDLLRARQEHCIVGHHGTPGADRRIELSLVVDVLRVVAPA